ncbi:CBS domain-containing protein [Streptomyces sp. MBT49]|uniref:CBS domain-containing protein n=1 Tax=Streptomyces TaxID=1883 RepID=UPI00190B84ED|nr:MULTISPECIES: CBS domain-containing protein [unclassified Streptomyces]MBK3624367.1 CBS domain-containing protein [Streptomyces sp. MBT49]MBK3636764.1 CBS domain-containing protein [Streptomyces sp. MBT97]
MHGTPHIVSDVMTHTVAAVGRRATFKEIVRLMRDWRISALPVLEGEGRVVGVVSEADLLPKEEFRDSDPGPGLPPPAPVPPVLTGPPGEDAVVRARRAAGAAKAGAVTAEELMTSPALTVRADTTLAQAARVMAHAKVKRLPVVDAVGMLEGIVSRTDLLKVFLRTDEEIAEEVRREIVSYLFPLPESNVRVDVRDGVVTLVGRARDTSLVPVAARLVRAVEGVVDVDFDLTRPAAAEETPSRTTGNTATA